MYASAADQDGNYGCQVWISKRISFKLHQFEVVSPRITIVAGEASAMAAKMQIISAHAPCEHAAFGVKDLFWR
eukprot:9227327-Karenia_brevis.AAC.1